MKMFYLKIKIRNKHKHSKRISAATCSACLFAHFGANFANYKSFTANAMFTILLLAMCCTQVPAKISHVLSALNVMTKICVFIRCDAMFV